MHLCCIWLPIFYDGGVSRNFVSHCDVLVSVCLLHRSAPCHFTPFPRFPGYHYIELHIARFPVGTLCPLYIVLVLWGKEAKTQEGFDPTDLFCFIPTNCVENAPRTTFLASGYDQVHRQQSSSALQQNLRSRTTLWAPGSIHVVPCDPDGQLCLHFLWVQPQNSTINSHVREKHPPHADVTPNYYWCFSMDSDQNRFTDGQHVKANDNSRCHKHIPKI